MPLWKINDGHPQPVPETDFPQAKIRESEIESWIASEPLLLGEPLLIIGRQVPVEGLGDTMDLLALDASGALVVIEIKRKDLRAPVDVQALRYASYVSRWSAEDLEEVATGYYDDEDEDDRSLDDRFQEFVDTVSGDSEALNHSQRIIIVGQRVRDRLGSVALWLREQGIDIKLVELHPYKNEKEIVLSPVVIIPPQGTERWEKVGKKGVTEKPWLADGKAWHLQRAGKESMSRAEQLIENLSSRDLVEDASYSQKLYISLRRKGRTWLYLHPRRSQLVLDARVIPAKHDREALAASLGVELFEGELKDKLALGSSVSIIERRRGRWVLSLRLKNDYDISSPALLDLLEAVALRK